MRKFWFASLALAVCLMFSGTALAKGDKGNHGNGQGNSAGHGHGHDTDGDNRPPGWDKGKKSGWGDCDLPPGQAKKQGCNSTQTAHHHHRDRDHDRDRTVHHTYTHHTYTHRTTHSRTTTTRRPVTTQNRTAPGSNSSIILQRKPTTTTPGTQVQNKKPIANPN
jgi:hypothetical protein